MGGFVPQSPIDSVQLADSTMVRNAKKGHKGNFFIHFSFSFLVVQCCRVRTPRWIHTLGVFSRRKVDAGVPNFE